MRAKPSIFSKPRLLANMAEIVHGEGDTWPCNSIQHSSRTFDADKMVAIDELDH